jgi:hypothetical protein
MINDNTGTMFQLITGNGGDDLAADLGLSAAAVSLLSAEVGQSASSEEMLVSLVIMSANTWLEVVEQAIEDLETQCSSVVFDYDIKVLKGMGGWTFDRQLMENLAREEWFRMFCAGFYPANQVITSQTMH